MAASDLTASLTQRLAQRILILDGGMGTMLQNAQLSEDDFRHFHIAAPGKRFRLAQDIGDVPPRIFGDPVPDRLCLEAAAECERYDMQDKSPWWLLPPNVGTTVSASRPINI